MLPLDEVVADLVGLAVKDTDGEAVLEAAKLLLGVGALEPLLLPLEEVVADPVELPDTVKLPLREGELETL